SLGKMGMKVMVKSMAFGDCAGSSLTELWTATPPSPSYSTSISLSKPMTAPLPYLVTLPSKSSATSIHLPWSLARSLAAASSFPGSALGPPAATRSQATRMRCRCRDMTSLPYRNRGSSPARVERPAQQPAHAAESVQVKEAELGVAGLLWQLVRPSQDTNAVCVPFPSRMPLLRISSRHLL